MKDKLFIDRLLDELSPNANSSEVIKTWMKIKKEPLSLGEYEDMLKSYEKNLRVKGVI
jgi:hypothetical protein